MSLMLSRSSYKTKFLCIIFIGLGGSAVFSQGPVALGTLQAQSSRAYCSHKRNERRIPLWFQSRF